MDWKPWYRAEAESAHGRALVGEALGRFPDGDPAVRFALSRRGAASFPHTTLLASAEPLARVATSILAEGFERVVALGVLHGSTLCEPERGLFRAAADGDEGAIARVGGAFFDPTDAVTPFGTVPAGRSPTEGPALRRGDRVLAHEFSLDLFVAVLAEAARRRGLKPPSVLRVFVGPGRADAVAAAIRPLLGTGVALVATGDLVHAGHGYSAEEEVAALPTEEKALAARFEPKVVEMLRLGLSGSDGAAGAAALAQELRSDQRHVMSALAALVGPGARADLLSFRLADYSTILGRPAPCVVGSALVTIRAAGKASA